MEIYYYYLMCNNPFYFNVLNSRASLWNESFTNYLLFAWLSNFYANIPLYFIRDFFSVFEM